MASANERARAAGITLNTTTTLPNLAPSIQIGNTIYTSGHVSVGYQGRLGADLTIAEGKKAARVCAKQLLQSAYQAAGSLEHVRCVRLLGCVNSAPDFTEQERVIACASELVSNILGKEKNCDHVCNALDNPVATVGFAVEIEGIFEIVDG